MKTVLILSALFYIIFASKAEVKLLKQQRNVKQSVKEILQLEKVILKLFRYVDQPDYYDDQKEIAVNYDIEDHIDSYQNSQAVREFWDLNRLGFLPKDDVFSIFNERHRREAISLFKILYYAKDLDTLYRTACWARLFMNGGLFVYSLSVALVHRPDTYMINLPPIYEIYPNYFYNVDVIRKAQEARKAYVEEIMSPVTDRQPPMPSMMPPSRMPPSMMPPSMMPPSMMPPSMMSPPVMSPPMPSMQEATANLPRQNRDTIFNVPLPVNPDVMYRGKAPPQPFYPPWYQMMFEGMRPMGLDPVLYRLDSMREDELRQRQLRQAQMMQKQIKQGKLGENEDNMSAEELKIVPDTTESITIDANYSTPRNDLEKEFMLSYFTEDVGLSAYYYYYNIYYPFWLPEQMTYFRTDRRGEQFYYIIQQILARYYLERLSNGLGDISSLDYTIPILTGYYPSMMYPNGMMFPVRPSGYWIPVERSMENTRFDNNYTNSYSFARNYERRIMDAVDLGYVYSSDGERINLQESPNARFYGYLQISARLMLGNARPALVDRELVIAPSALEHFETSLRDPIFYRFYKRMLMYFQRYLNNVPSYSTKELLMPGVKIEDVQIVDPLMTYFEYDEIDISNAVYNKQTAENVAHVPVRVRQMRLNNKPYRYVMSVNSDRAYSALVKVFLGPKYDEMGRRLDITESRLNYVEIDKFLFDLAPGANRIQRSSLQNYYTSDRTSYREMYRRVMMDLSRPTLPEYEPRMPEWYMPRRLLLPRGTAKGQMYQMYFIITPSMSAADMPKKSAESSMEWPIMVENRSLGFPLDRPIDENYFYVPNSFSKDVIITHMAIPQIGSTATIRPTLPPKPQQNSYGVSNYNSYSPYSGLGYGNYNTLPYRSSLYSTPYGVDMVATELIVDIILIVV
ncbi:hypothetical protein Trydic_g13982 [Trypoxylus dichotomus]